MKILKNIHCKSRLNVIVASICTDHICLYFRMFYGFAVIVKRAATTNRVFVIVDRSKRQKTLSNTIRIGCKLSNIVYHVGFSFSMIVYSNICIYFG